MRHHLFPDGSEKGGITKHLAHLNGKVPQNSRQHCGIVQQVLLQRRKASEPQLLARVPETPFHGGHPIIAEIIVISGVEGLQEEAEFDVLYLLGRETVCHREIQTRTTDRSFSTSKGFAI